MEVEIIPPVECTLCKGTRVLKKRVDKLSGLACTDCSKIVLSNGKVIPLDAERLGGATDPSYEMGDRIENTIGVHEHNGNFCNGVK